MTITQKIIKQLDLKPHREGGYYKETYQSEILINRDNQTQRHINTAIYYLLESHDFSCWHRLASDEMWHHYSGSELTIYEINQQGELIQTIVGNPTTSEHAIPQYLVPANTWFAATVNQAGSFSLLGCTVAPGFNYDDFEIANRNNLIAQYPQHKELIAKLTR